MHMVLMPPVIGSGHWVPVQLDDDVTVPKETTAVLQLQQCMAHCAAYMIFRSAILCTLWAAETTFNTRYAGVSFAP